MASPVHVGVMFARDTTRTRLGVLYAMRPKPVEGECGKCGEHALEERAAFPFDVPLPCGQRYRARGPEDLPLHSIPCPCGTPGHWLVLWAADLEVPHAG